MWQADMGELQLGDRTIRRVRVKRTPSNIHRILDAFQAAGWPRRVRNPLSLGQQQIHETLRYLNRNQEMIRFRSQGGGGAITWELL